MKRLERLVITLSLVAVCAGQAFAAGSPDHKMEALGQSPGGTKGMMQQMMKEPHHKLLMAHKKHLMNLAKTLKTEVAKTGTVEKQFAEGAVEEMKRSLGQMKKHHDEHKSMMSKDMLMQMDDHIKMMENRLSVVQQHVDQLDQLVKAESPDPKKVTTELDQILKQCDMMEMHMKKQKKSGK